jgi:hypothetical protein
MSESSFDVGVFEEDLIEVMKKHGVKHWAMAGRHSSGQVMLSMASKDSCTNIIGLLHCLISQMAIRYVSSGESNDECN